MESKFEEDFENWFYREYSSSSLYDMWMYDEITLSMQWGVYVDFFDEHGIYLEDSFYWGGTMFKCEVFQQFDCGQDKCTNLIYSKEGFKTRQEARAAALQKAKELFNKQSK